MANQFNSFISSMNVRHSSSLQQTLNEQGKMVSILYLKIWSAINKWQQLEVLLATIPVTPDIITIVETWLYEDETQFYNILGYEAFHCTRPRLANKGRGGGTAI